MCAKLKLITTALHLVPLSGGYLEIAPTPHPVIRPVLPKVHNHGSQKSKNWFRNITWVLNFFYKKVWWITTQKPSVLYQFFFGIPASGGSSILTLFFLKKKPGMGNYLQKANTWPTPVSTNKFCQTPYLPCTLENISKFYYKGENMCSSLGSFNNFV